jgi:acetyl esterase/lipase
MVMAVLLLAGCSGLQALNLITPRSGYDLHEDIAYGALPRQKLDVYVPKQPDSFHTVVFFIYGGSWQMGDKNLYRFVGQNLAAHGITTIIADYRLYPQVYYPVYVEDTAKAFHWTHDHVAQYGGSANHVYIAGHSAGAHLALMMTLNQRFLKEQGGDTSWIKGVIGIAGPYDFLPFTDPKIKKLFSKVPDQETQPINYVRAGLPPILLLHGNTDKDVYLKNSQHLADKLKKYHDSVVFKTYDDVNHIDIVLVMASGFEGRAMTLSDMLEFIDQQNKK